MHNSNRVDYPGVPSRRNSYYRYSPYHEEKQLYCGLDKRNFNNSSGRENSWRLVENRDMRYSYNSRSNNNISTNEPWSTTPRSSRPVQKKPFYKKRYSGRKETVDISLYFDPTCMEDPWAEFEDSVPNKETTELKSENITVIEPL